MNLRLWLRKALDMLEGNDILGKRMVWMSGEVSIVGILSTWRLSSVQTREELGNSGGQRVEVKMITEAFVYIRCIFWRISISTSSIVFVVN